MRDLDPRLIAMVSANAGLTIGEAAHWLGMDRGTLAANLVTIPPGQVPALNPGEFPARLIGGRRVIIPSDLIGLPTAPASASSRVREEIRHGQNHQEEAADAMPPGRDFNRQMDQLRRRRS